jgi:DNA sulfur modification protein DndC
VENPKVVEFIRHVLASVQKAAKDQGMPITVHETIPVLEETFWVNVIGRGYPAPNNIFRWCTERLKINPTTKFILEKINQSGEAIILLGTRSDESSNRSRSIQKHHLEGRRLRKHTLTNAFVFAPISDILTEEVWQYLASVPAPWGGNHHRLITLYRNASGGDCPLVIDLTTPSCGTSRFGCWVCTVVKRDKSMEALIDHGEEWMIPLLEIREYLVETRDNGEKYRSKTRRNGTTTEGVYGPYLPEVRYELLKKLLIAQYEIQQNDSFFELISHQELVAIQVIWLRDNIFNYRVSDLYNEIYQRQIDMTRYNRNQEMEDEILLSSCQNSRTDFELIKDLLELERNKVLILRKRGIHHDIKEKLERHLKDTAQKN